MKMANLEDHKISFSWYFLELGKGKVVLKMDILGV